MFRKRKGLKLARNSHKNSVFHNSSGFHPRCSSNIIKTSPRSSYITSTKMTSRYSLTNPIAEVDTDRTRSIEKLKEFKNFYKYFTINHQSTSFHNVSSEKIGTPKRKKVESGKGSFGQILFSP